MTRNGLPANLKGRLKSGAAKIAVIGLGQVGLPLALNFVKEGASVIGVDIDDRKINSIRRGVCPSKIASLVQLFNQNHKNLQVTTKVTEAVKECRVHILCVPTPLGGSHAPDLNGVISASAEVGRELKKDDLVILESTVYPGTTTGVVQPVLEENSGLSAGRDFQLAYCFERVDPGNTEHRTDNTPRVIGAIDVSSALSAAEVYGLIIRAPISRVRNCETAEMVKLIENIYRDINIAFANEVALLCEKLGTDIIEVLKAASTKWSFSPHLPGAGVGGTCIPVNPYYLLKCAEEAGVDLKLVRQARQINEGMPHHMVNLVQEALAKTNKPVKEAKICVLGLAYKSDVDDSRGSPGEQIARELELLGARVVCYDPLVTPEPPDIGSESSLERAAIDADCILIATDHSAFKSLDLKAIAGMAHRPLTIVDGRHVLVPREVEAAGIIYIGLGRASDSDLTIWNSGLKASK